MRTFVLIILTILISCCNVFIVKGQCEDEFAFRVGSTSKNVFPKVAAYNETSFWLYSSFTDTLLLGNDTIVIDSLDKELYLIKYGFNGNFLSYLKIRGSNTLIHGGITVNNVNEVYVCGSFKDSLFVGDITLVSLGEEDMFVLKADSNGNTIWVKKYGSINKDICNTISVLNDTLLFFGGAYIDSTALDSVVLYRNGDNDLEAFFAKADSAGNIIYARHLGGLYTDITYSIEATDKGSLYIAGTFNDIIRAEKSYAYGIGNNDIFLAKYDIKFGYLNWIKSAGGRFKDFFADISIDTSGNIYAIGNYIGTATLFDSTTLGNGNYDVFQRVLNASGALIWNREIGHVNLEMASASTVSKNKRLYTALSFNRYTEIKTGATDRKINSKGGEDIIILKSNNEQNIWVKSVGSIGNDYASDIKWVNSNHLIITGIFNADIAFTINNEINEIVTQKKNNVFLWKTCD